MRRFLRMKSRAASRNPGDIRRAPHSVFCSQSDAIKLVPGSVNNTAAEIAAVARFAQTGSTEEPVILVTSKSHTRRVRVIWDALTQGRQQVIVRYAESDPYDGRGWWHTTTDVFTTGREVFGILNARAGFPISPRER